MTDNTIAAAVSVAEAISRELDEDSVGVWKIMWQLRQGFPDLSESEVECVVEGVLKGLEPSGVTIGTIDSSGVFNEWSHDGAINDLMLELHKLGRDPNIGEVAWLARRR